MVERERVLQAVGCLAAMGPEPPDVVEEHIKARVGREDLVSEPPDLGLRRHVGDEDVDRVDARLTSDRHGRSLGT